MCISPDGRREMILRLFRLRQVERKWDEEEQLDFKEEDMVEVVEEVEEVAEIAGLVGVWHIWYFPNSGQGWGWISGPETQVKVGLK